MSLSNVRHFGRDEILAAVSMDAAVESQSSVLRALAEGTAAMGPRALLDYGGNTAFSYLARASAAGWPVVKLGSVNPGNADAGLPLIHALVLIMDRVSGAVVATADGEAVTLLRTPAASLAAARALVDADRKSTRLNSSHT